MSFRNSPMEGRGIIRALLSISGDLRVTGGLIEVHLDQQSGPHYALALQSLCQHLNALRPRLHETNYQLRSHVKPRPIGEQTKTIPTTKRQALWSPREVKFLQIQ